MNKEKNKIIVLITGVGSELAFSVINALKISSLNYHLIGTDIYPEVVGKYWCHTFYQVPPVRDEQKYLTELKNIIKKEGVSILIPTVDQEFEILSKHKNDFHENLNCHVLINDWEELNRFNDKWSSYEWYVEHNIPTPKSFLIDEAKDLTKLNLEYPMIIKPREGGGSRSIFKINSLQDILKYISIVPKPLLQEYLFPDNEEYTAGTFRTEANEIYTIILKRTLKFGMTNTAEVVFNKTLDAFAKDVILKTNLIGSNNIQFRVTKDGPKVLEINPRFSGTTGIRANFGFNDVEMWINQVLSNGEIPQPKIKEGFVLRYMQEQYHIK